jgi:hypothetical protein
LIPTEAGIYEVRPAGAPGSRPRLVAVNIPGRELDLARFDQTRLTNSISAPAGTTTAGAATPAEADLAERERKQSVWWYLLLIAATLLVVESVLAHRLSRGRVTVS